MNCLFKWCLAAIMCVASAAGKKVTYRKMYDTNSALSSLLTFNS